MTHVADVRPQRQHEEKPAQDILSLSHPSDRFGPEGMAAKIAAANADSPQLPGHPLQNEKEKNYGGGVQKHVRQVVATGVKAIDLTVHMRAISSAAPTTGVALEESRGHCLRTEPTPNLGVIIHG